jgi:outer membrane protein assembly factor BamD
MNIFRQTFIIILLFALFLSSCSTSGKVETGSFIERYEKGSTLYEDEKYYKAIDHFTFVVYNAPGSDVADEAQFKLASCHYHLKEYLVAIDEFRRLLLRWPASSLAEEADFMIGEAYYQLSPIYQRDQTYTYEAIRHYQNFIETYPYSKFRKTAEERIQELRLKLTRKIYDAGKLYMVLREWKSAIITFEEIVDQYYDTHLYHPTLLELAECYKKIGDTEKMKEIYRQIDLKKLPSVQDRMRYNTLLEDSGE